MTENRRIAFGRLARVLLAVAVLALGASELTAQGVGGKVQGTVLDPTGQPVANAQVFVLGTAFAALTNEDGFYFFNNVPAGTYDMRAQFIGYQPAEVRALRVLGDQTLTVNFGLSGAVALEAITITAAETPIVPRDQVTSKTTITGQTIDQLPVDDPRAAISLQPGVVESCTGRDSNSPACVNGLSLRGGRPGEAVVYVDGVPVRRLRTGAAQLNVGTNAAEEASVTTGALGAEYGDAQSGVISLVTRSGGPRFQGNLVYETDEVFGNSISVGFNRFEGSLSGPIFGNLTFFVGGTLRGEVSNRRGMGWEDVPYYTLGGLDSTLGPTVTIAGEAGDSATLDIPRFVQFTGTCPEADPESQSALRDEILTNYGQECQGRRLPYDFSTQWRANAKLTYSYGTGSRVSLSGLLDQDQDRTNPGNGVFNPDAYQGTRTNSQVYILNWVQQVFRTAETELAFDLNLSWQIDRQRGGVLDKEWDLNNRSPAMGLSFSTMKFLVDFDTFSADTADQYELMADGRSRTINALESQDDWERLIKNVRDNLGTRLPYLDRGDLLQKQTYRMNPYGMITGWRTGGLDRGFGQLGYERRAIGRLNVDWQFDRYNRLKFGVEGMSGRVNEWNASIQDPAFQDIFAQDPKRWAAYIQDRLDLGDVVLELGLRWDSWNADGVFPLTPARTFTHPAYDPDLPIEQLTCVGSACEADSAIYEFVWAKAETHTAWSPRLRVSFPVTDRTNVRLSYAHQVQSPDGENVYGSMNNDLTITNTNDAFGGDVRHGKTIMFEFGVRHAFTRDLVFDLAMFNKDKVADLTYRIIDFFDPLVERIAPVNVLTNADFGNTKGFELSLLQRIGNWFNGQVSYTFQAAKGTGSNPRTYLNTTARSFVAVTGDRQPPAQATFRTDDDRSHNITGSLSFNWPNDFEQGTWYGQVLRNAGLFMRFRFVSGLPYTKLVDAGRGQQAFGGTPFGLEGENEDDVLNGRELPWQYNFDLRVTKGLRLGPTDWTLYADFRNLFNIRNVVGVFAETGDVTSEEYFDSQVSSELTRLRGDAGSARQTTVIKDGEEIEAIDVSDCDGWTGTGNEASCVLVRGAEARFGNGDMIYDLDEQLTALGAWYQRFNGEQVFLGNPLHIRLGVELAF